MHRRIKIVLGLSLIVLFSSCAKKLTEGEEKLPKVKDKDLIELVDSISHRRPDFFYSKIDTKYKDSLQRVSFKTSLRIKADSAVHTIISFARIPIITAVVTSDSVKISNKKDKCHILQTTDYFKEAFGVDFTLKNIEELMLGLPLDYNPEEKYVQLNDPFNYIISSHNKREIRRTERGRQDDIIIQYYINEDLSHLKGMLIESPNDSTIIRVNYPERVLVDGYSVPKMAYIVIDSPRNHIEIELDYGKVEINDPREIFIVIPEDYESCN